jgi:hypothetical protein
MQLMGKYLDMLKAEAEARGEAAPVQPKQPAPTSPPRPKRRPETPPAEPISRCWRCGCDSPIPTLDRQVDIVEDIHRAYGDPYLWTKPEWQKLRQILQEGDVLELIRSSLGMPLAADYGGVWVDRQGVRVYIDRRQLREV